MGTSRTPCFSNCFAHVYSRESLSCRSVPFPSPLVHGLSSCALLAGNIGLLRNRRDDHEVVGLKGLHECLLLRHDWQHLLGGRLGTGEANLDPRVVDRVPLEADHRVARILIALEQDEAVAFTETRGTVALHGTGDDLAEGFKESAELLVRVVRGEGSNINVAAVRRGKKGHGKLRVGVGVGWRRCERAIDGGTGKGSGKQR